MQLICSVNTAKQIISAIGKCSLGVVWIAYAVYDFADCIKNKKEENAGEN